MADPQVLARSERFGRGLRFATRARTSSRRTRRGACSGGLALALLALAGPSRADLLTPALFNQFTALEKIAAQANQAVFNELDTICNPQTSRPNNQCTPAVAQVYQNVRELVDTANQLTGTGPTTFSLNVDAQGLGFALQWTAAEEMAAQNAAAKNFTNTQLSALSTRITALRYQSGAGGKVSLSADGRQLAYHPAALGGGASADDSSIMAGSRWGVFGGDSYEWGHRRDSTYSGGYEDAFAFDGNDSTIGADYRVNRSLVVGAIAGYSKRTVGFNQAESIVNARLETHGMSVTAYFLQEWERWYVTGSAGSQWLNENLVRKITYPSFNPLAPSVNETAISDTSSNTLTASLEAGYNRSYGAFGVEPFLKAAYRDVYIHGFTEANAKGFDFAVDQQSLQPVDTAVGLRLQYVITPRFGGVAVPYVHAEWHHEFNNGPQAVTGSYVPLKGLGSFAATGAFVVPSDKPDNDFGEVTPGLSLVLPHGIQVYAQYQEVLGLRYYSDHSISGGLRFEF